MKIQEAIIKVRLRSEAEAVALNFSPEMGLEVYDGIVADDLNEWTDETYLDWCKHIESKYKVTFDEWKPLYSGISKIMGEYASLMEL